MKLLCKPTLLGAVVPLLIASGGYLNAATCTATVSLPATCTGTLTSESGTAGSVVEEQFTLASTATVTIYHDVVWRRREPGRFHQHRRRIRTEYHAFQQLWARHSEPECQLLSHSDP